MNLEYYQKMSNYPAGAEFDPSAPWNEEDLDNNCGYCGEPTDGYYCDKNCEKADMND